MAITLLCSLLVGCDSTSSTSASSGNDLGLPNKGTVVNDGVSIFPKSSEGYVGDPMPYFDGEKMNVFYLLQESNQSAVGFHPWALMQTEDFSHFTDRGVVIPYVKNVASQDLALGTGSVIKDQNGLYHAFYTGYNGTGNTDYFEKVQHATSPDLLTWTKIPEDGFYGGNNDFRDPYVLYMESENLYWMLVATRDSNDGVLKLYKSSNLSTWVYDSIFFRNDDGTYNMECPTLIKFGNYWYLSFSEQGSFRVVHYRYRSDLSSGSWIRPSVDYFDGVGVYAGRMEKAWNNLYFCGWQANKQYDYDGGDFDWGGNLATHQMVVQPNGELRPAPVAKVSETLHTEVYYALEKASTYATHADRQVVFVNGSSYEYALYETLESKATRLTFDITLHSETGKFGIAYTVKNDAIYGDTNIVFNLDEQALEFYNVKASAIGTNAPQASVPLIAHDGDVLHVAVHMEAECLTVYVDGQQALSTRSYLKSGKMFGFINMESSIEINDICFFE